MKRWPTKPLEEITELYGGSTPSRDRPAYWGGNIYWVTPTDLPMPDEGISVVSKTKYRITQAGLDNSSATVVPKGTVLFSSRATIGKVAVAGMPLTTNQGFANFIPLSEVTSRFLAYALWFHREDIARLSGSTTFKEVSKSSLRKYHLPVPPLVEQDRIVKLLDEADELRKLRTQADRRTSALIPSLFHEMFGDPVENSKGWPCVQLVGLCRSADDIKCGPFGTQLSKSEYMEKGVPLWGIKNVNALFELPTREFITPSTAQRLIQYSIEPCDIVMTRKGTVGNCAVYPERFPLGIMHSDLLRLRVSREKCEPVFLAHQLHYSRDVERQLAQISGGAVMPGINVTKLKSLKVLAPSLPLQKEFATRVSGIRALQGEQAASRHRLDDLFQSMLHRAFQGEL